jgi:NAD(P)-dependent dehydrogenase (short-subunit alcohol dehydrogenase family)
MAIDVDLSDTTADRDCILQRVTDAFEDNVDILVNNAAAARRFELQYSSMDAETFASRSRSLSGRVGISP